MIISCLCLNVSINTKSTSLEDVDALQLELTAVEQADPFFKEDICTVEIVRISKEQGSFVQVRNIGNWIIHRCLNCSINTHALHRERGAAYVLVSRAMLANPTEIAALKASGKYSTVFRIVVDRSDVGYDAALQSPSRFTVSQLAEPVQTAMSAIQQQLNEAIQQEVAQIEEKIRVYSEQQYAALEEFRETAHNDHRTLVRLLYEAKDSLSSVAKPSFMEITKAAPIQTDDDKIVHQLSTSVPQLPFSNLSTLPLSPKPGNVISSANRRQPVEEPFMAAKLLKSNNSAPVINESGASSKTEKHLKSRFCNQSSTNKPEGSLDAEGLFDLEGMEDIPAEVFHSEEETDTDDSASRDEGIHIPRGRSSQYAMAKSLPMNVPVFLSANIRAENADEDERHHPQDPMAIAASIKALARSVHGDANVFGELPRPRFSTQI